MINQVDAYLHEGLLYFYLKLMSSLEIVSQMSVITCFKVLHLIGKVKMFSSFLKTCLGSACYRQPIFMLAIFMVYTLTDYFQ